MALAAFSAVLVMFAAFWVASPLLKKSSPPLPTPSDEATDDLLEAKEAVYRSLLDLDFDRKTGKVSEEDYPAMRSQYEAEALEILAALDAAEPAIDVLEKEIAAARERLRNR